jgi:hypothetical protein
LARALRKVLVTAQRTPNTTNIHEEAMTATTTIAISNYSPNTLEDTPRRALDLLRGIGSSPSILRLMRSAGYSAKVHEEGQRLLADVVGFVQEREAFNIDTSTSHMAAMADLDTWTRTVFRRLRASATRFYPDVAKALFANLVLSDEMDAALLAKIFIDRVDALATDTTDAKASKALLKMFTQRGFDADDIEKLKKLVAVTQSPPQPPSRPDAENDADNAAAKRAARLQLLATLRGWYDDWSETARTVLSRRDHLIRVGLAHRKVRSSSPTPAPSPVNGNDTTPPS